MENEPRHNELMHQYELPLDGKLALLKYVEREDGALVLTHTFVPPELRGRDLAARLTRYALEDVRSRGKKVVPQCSYAVTFLERNKEYADMVAES